MYFISLKQITYYSLPPTPRPRHATYTAFKNGWRNSGAVCCSEDMFLGRSDLLLEAEEAKSNDRAGLCRGFSQLSVHSRALLCCLNTCAAKALVLGDGKLYTVFDSLLTFYCFMRFIKNGKLETFKAASTSYIHTHMLARKRGKSLV